jgi:hypothetical protein
VAGQPSGALPPPPTLVSFFNERTPLSAYVAAASCARALSESLYPLPLLVSSLLTIFKALQNIYALMLDIFHKKSCVSFVSGAKEVGVTVNPGQYLGTIIVPVLYK